MCGRRGPWCEQSCLLFFRNRRRGGLKHVPEVPRAASEYGSAHQTKHRDVSACLQRSEMKCKNASSSETAFTKKARMSRVDSSQCGFGSMIFKLA